MRWLLLLAMTPEVAVSVETNAPPAPETSTPNDATEALKRQIGALAPIRDDATASADREAGCRRAPSALVGIDTGGERKCCRTRRFPPRRTECRARRYIAGIFFDFMEEQLAALKHPAEAATHMADEMQARAAQSRTPEPPPRPTRVQYSAPVSRDVPNSNGKRTPGKVTLTPQDQEAARISGISLEEYAKQKMRLAAMRASGEYSGSEDRR